MPANEKFYEKKIKHCYGKGRIRVVRKGPSEGTFKQKPHMR